ncbi:MAG TPA: AGE family epimerase/isomerase, partial [Tepidisphaeraceae bacterium]
MNTHIHLLEALTELYQVWPDPVLHDRLQEMLGIVRDKVCTDDGAMNMFFEADWKPVSVRDSYGHDIETAYLLLEATEALGQPDDAKTNRIAKALVDHVLKVGWDAQHGGVYNEGKFGGAADELDKDWWPQFESLNSLLMMHEKYGKENPQYFKDFQMQWNFIKTYQIDHEDGGVYESLHADGAVANPSKARMWKGGYHDGRALMNVTARLRKLAE